MSEARTTEVAGASAPTWVLRTGGIAALLLAAGYLATIPLFASVGAPPTDAQARLEFHATTTAAWWGIVALAVLTDLLFLPVAAGLYAALRRTNQPAMLLAIAAMVLFVVLDLAVTQPAYASLITLGRQYGMAATGEERGLLVAAAGYPSAVLSSTLQAVDSILTLSIGILGVGLVMLRSGFGRSPALVGVAVGVLGIGSVAQTAATGTLSPLAIATTLLTIAWLALVGRVLLFLAP